MGYSTKTMSHGVPQPSDGASVSSSPPYSSHSPNINNFLTQEDADGILANARLSFNGVFVSLLERLARGESSRQKDVLRETIDYVKTLTSSTCFLDEYHERGGVKYFIDLGIQPHSSQNGFKQLFDAELELLKTLTVYVTTAVDKKPYSRVCEYMNQRLNQSLARQQMRKSSGDFKKYLDSSWVSCSSPEKGNLRRAGLRSERIIRKSTFTRGDERF